MDDENLTMAAGNNAYKIKPVASFHMLPVGNNAKNTLPLRKLQKKFGFSCPIRQLCDDLRT